MKKILGKFLKEIGVLPRKHKKTLAKNMRIYNLQIVLILTNSCIFSTILSPPQFFIPPPLIHDSDKNIHLPLFIRPPKITVWRHFSHFSHFSFNVEEWYDFTTELLNSFLILCIIVGPNLDFNIHLDTLWILPIQ